MLWVKNHNVETCSEEKELINDNECVSLPESLEVKIDEVLLCFVKNAEM